LLEPLSTAVLVLFIVLNALLAVAHSALVNVSKPHLRELADGGNKRARYALKISEDASRLLTSFQLATAFLRFAAAVILTLTLAPAENVWLRGHNIAPEWASAISIFTVVVIGTLALVVFGEMVPAAFAATRPERVAILFARPMALVMGLLAPLSHLMLWLTNRTLHLFGGRGSTSYVTEEEIKTLVDAGSEEGVLEDEEKEMIYSIFQFGDMIARELMVPRIDIVALEADASIDEALDLIIKEGHSRIPVYEESVDSITGLLYAKDLLRMWQEARATGAAKTVREAIRPAYFVPESKKAGDLLEDLQQRKIHLAIVIDEYGGTAGLVTIEDLVEEIVGDIKDEYDLDEEADYEEISETEYIFDAGINLQEVNRLLDVELPTDDNDTLGGFVFSELGKIPLVGETLRTKEVEMKVESVIGRRIRKVRVRKPGAQGTTIPVTMTQPEAVRADADDMTEPADVSANATAVSPDGTTPPSAK